MKDRSSDNSYLQNAARILSSKLDIKVGSATSLIRERAGMKAGEKGDPDKIADAYLDLLEANGFS